MELPVINTEQQLLEVILSFSKAKGKPPQRMLEKMQTLIQQKQEASLPKKTKSKMALLLEDLDNDPNLNLEGYSGQLMEDIKEFRDSFEFEHDK